MDAPEQWFTSAEAAAFLKLSKPRLRKLMHDGHLVEGVHYTRPAGMRVRFKLSGLVRYLNQPTTRTRTRGWPGVDKVNMGAA